MLVRFSVESFRDAGMLVGNACVVIMFSCFMRSYDHMF